MADLSVLKSSVLSAVLLAVVLFQAISSSPTVPRTELRFDSEFSAVKTTNEQDCIDMTDCDPYGPYMCNSSKADRKWAMACCREYCGYCNTTIPKNQYCDRTPPSFYS